MDRQVDEAEAKTGTTEKPEAKQPVRSGHLMCRSALWGVAGCLACAYFTWLSFWHVARNEYDWPHDGWTAATYIVWIVVLAGLTLDTRCLRERLFFGVLMLDFAIGFGMTVWRTIPATDVRAARIGTGALWALAGLVSLTTIGRSRSVSGGEKQSGGVST